MRWSWMMGAWVAVAGHAAAGDGYDPHADVIELRHTDAALHATYEKGKRMMLPRVLLFDAAMKPLVAQFGWGPKMERKLDLALRKDEPFESPLTLELTLGETITEDGRSLAVADLPKADGYVVDYWAVWCSPCHAFERDIITQMHRWHDQGKRVIWLKIESDPQKQRQDSSTRVR